MTQSSRLAKYMMLQNYGVSTKRVCFQQVTLYFFHTLRVTSTFLYQSLGQCSVQWSANSVGETRKYWHRRGGLTRRSTWTKMSWAILTCTGLIRPPERQSVYYKLLFWYNLAHRNNTLCTDVHHFFGSNYTKKVKLKIFIRP